MVSLVHVVGISVCNCRRLFGATKSYELRFVFLCRRKDDTDMSDPPQKTTKKKGYAETHTGHQYKIKADLKRKLFEMFTGQGMNRKHSLDFLRYVEHDLRTEEPQDVVNCRRAVEEQYNTLSQPQKRTLTTLLTHKMTEGVDDEINTVLNEEVLSVLPFLRRRSVRLRANSGMRKIRQDKIDLEFISDFMHNHCRYFLARALITVECSKTLFVLLQVEHVWIQSLCG